MKAGWIYRSRKGFRLRRSLQQGRLGIHCGIYIISQLLLYISGVNTYFRKCSWALLVARTPKNSGRPLSSHRRQHQ